MEDRKRTNGGSVVERGPENSGAEFIERVR